MATTDERYNPEDYLRSPLRPLPTDELELLENAIAGGPPPRMPVGYPTVVFVTNIPAAPADKIPKLTAILIKIFSNVGEFDQTEGFVMPTNEDGSTKGFAFIEYADEKGAKLAIETLNGYRLDKTHIFSVRSFEEIEKYRKVPDEYVPLQIQQTADQENPFWFVEDKENLMHDQFVTRFGNETQVCWNTRKRGNSVFIKEGFTDSYLAWSPSGTYLATYHKKGIIFWGGETWSRKHVFEHPGVQLIDFSPSEKYLVTFAESNKESVIIWDIKANKKVVVLSGVQDDQWPIFKWSFDDRFFAKLVKGEVHIWEITKSATGTSISKLYHKLVLNNNKVQDFCWSPGYTPTFSYWIAESNNAPARIVVYDVVTKKEVRSKNIFNVKDCKMHWQNKGDYLCVKVDRENNKKVTSTNFEIFFCRERDIPIESIEIKDNIIAFAWETNGSRFAFIHAAPGVNKSDVSFYILDKLKAKKTKTLEKRQVTHLYWSPRGDNIVLATLKSSSGIIEFYNAALDLLYTSTEHYQTTNIEWDPSGRYVVTSASAWVHQMENGYIVWSFAGKQLTKNQRERFYQFLWRPRPQTLLTDRQIKDIKSNIKNYTKIFGVEEKERERQAKIARNNNREKSSSAFEALIAKRRAEIEKILQEKSARDTNKVTERDAVIIKRDVEEVIESFVQVIE